MSQLSLFSADLAEPRLEDLGGMLAAHGQVARGSAGTRLSILLDAPWRAEVLTRECRVRDVVAESSAPWADGEPAGVAEPPGEGGGDYGAQFGPGTTLLRTDWIPVLTDIAEQWSRGAVKSTPPDVVLGPGMLRCWMLAAGRPGATGFLLGLDPHAPEMYEPLAAACSRAGIAGSVIGVAAGKPAIRVVGRRRLLRLTELLGTPPPGAPADAFPRP